MPKPYIPGGRKRRVREFLRDADYFDKLSPADRQWLLDNYVDSDLNNRLKTIPDRPTRRKLDKANKAYYEDISNRSIQISLSKPDFDPDETLRDAVEKPRRHIRTETKDPTKRPCTGHVMTHRDWLPSFESADIEDALINWIDHTKETEE